MLSSILLQAAETASNIGIGYGLAGLGAGLAAVGAVLVLAVLVAALWKVLHVSPRL
jgi:hypothetical protein